MERKLRQADIPAVVRYLPPDQGCRSDTFTVITPSSERDALEAGGTIEMRGDGSLRLEIDKSALQPGQKRLRIVRPSYLGAQ